MPSNPSNDSIATALSINVNNGIQSRLFGTLDNASPVDYYKFRTTATSNLNVKLTGLDGNARLDVYAGNNENNPQTPATQVFSGTLSESFFRNDLPAGDYLIKITRESGTDPINYDLLVLASSGATSANTIVWQGPGSVGFWQMNGTQIGDYRGIPLVGYDVVGIGDLNGDGTDDVVLRGTGANATGPNSLAVWLLNRDNSFDNAAFVAGGITATATVAGVEDIDGDGKDDLIVRDGDSIRFIRMNGAQIQNERTITLPGLGQAKIAGFGDFDADGKTDILFEGPSAGGVRNLAIWFMNDNLSFREAGFLPVPLPNAIEIKAITDFNKSSVNGATKDNKSDLLLFNRVTGQLAVWLLDGLTIKDAKFLISDDFRLPSTFSVADVADFNGDGDSDILFDGPRSGIWLLNGAQLGADTDPRPEVNSAANFLQFNIAPLFKTSAARDFNNDGKADILFRGVGPTTTGLVAVWLMDGTQIKTVLNPATGAQEIAAETANFIKEPTPGSDTNFNLPLSFQAKGFVKTASSVAEPQGRGSADPTEAFDLGKLGIVPSEGKYIETFTNTAKRYYKFSLTRSSRVEITIPDPPGATDPTAVVRRVTGLVPNPLVDPVTPGTPVLPAGDYYIELQPTPTSLNNFEMNIKVTPSVVNLRGANLVVTRPGNTGPTIDSVSLDFPDNAVGVGPETPINVSFKLENNVLGQVATDSGPVEVEFFLSKTPQIVRDSNAALNPRETISLGKRTVQNVPANSSQQVIISQNDANALKLPGAASDFWTGDGDYYVLMQTDPTNAITETDESDNVLRGSPFDVDLVPIVNTQTADIYGAGIQVNGAFSATGAGTVSLTYTVANRGRKAATVPNNDVEATFYLFKSALNANNDVDFTPGTATTRLIPTSGSNSVLPALSGAPNITNPVTAQKTVTLRAEDTSWFAANPLAAGERYYIGIVYDEALVLPESDNANNFSTGIGKDIVAVTVA